MLVQGAGGGVAVVDQAFDADGRSKSTSLNPGTPVRQVRPAKAGARLMGTTVSLQQVASTEMQEKFAHYNLKLEEVLIGTPSSSPDKAAKCSGVKPWLLRIGAGSTPRSESACSTVLAVSSNN